MTTKRHSPPMSFRLKPGTVEALRKLSRDADMTMTKYIQHLILKELMK